jgi:glycosyltransferase involved in cell wall biosynthesis
MNEMQNNPYRLSLIIPAYNEEEGIDKVLNDLKFLGDDCEIIVVDDGSEDNTCEIIKKYENIKLLKHESNSGYGASLKTGIRNAKADVIVIMDADGTYPNERIPELVQILCEGDIDMLVGARTGDNANIPLIRKPAKWVINKIADYLSGVKIPDLNSGFRVMKKNVLGKYIRFLPDGFSFTTTITLALLTNGHSVKYVPIDYFKRSGKSKIRPIKDTLNFIQLIVRTVMYFDPLKIFIPLSLMLVAISIFILIGSWVFLEKTMDVTFGVILMTAIMVMSIGMLADLIDKRIQ